MTTEIRLYDENDTVIEVKFTKRSWGGWNVRRADNGRNLGWTFNSSEDGWCAYVDSTAFRGRSLTDTGRELDEVPEYLGGTITNAKRAGWGNRTREDAAYDLVSYLARKSATAITGERHWAVTDHSMPAWLAIELGYEVRDTDTDLDRVKS